MSKLFIGKISKNYPKQFTDNFYAAGKPDSKWYNGIQPGDYVFPIYNAKVEKLWRVKRYSDKPNPVNNEEGMVEFDLVKTFEAIPVAHGFLRQKYFELNLNTVNKSIKSAESGFFEITLSHGSPDIEGLDFKQKRNLYIVQEGAIDEPVYHDQDIRVRVSSSNGYNILGIEIFQGNEFKTYPSLWDLYQYRNPESERYSLQELMSYAEKDSAVKKLKYIRAVLEDIQEKGWFSVSSPVALYDNIIVGRKRTYTKKKEDKIETFNPALNDLFASVDDEFDEGQLEEYVQFKDLLENNPNLILYGPPGTGKTYAVQRIIECIERAPFKSILAEERVEFITFHQSYSYEEFVEGIRPVFSDNDTEDNGNSHLRYRVENGIIKKLANRAALSQLKEKKDYAVVNGIHKNSSPCYLVIDEINRGNISKIFGELITLIEKDKRDVLIVTLPYSRKPFKLPSNIYIIGTMNTADRSIAILDTALRRRFTFCEIEPNPEVLEKSENSMIEDEVDLKKLLESLNVKIQKIYDRDHRIGHSYFLELFNYRAFYITWYYKIIPLLMEYFYNDSKNVAKIITEKFIDTETSQIKRLEKNDFISAIKGIYGE